MKYPTSVLNNTNKLNNLDKNNNYYYGLMHIHFSRNNISVPENTSQINKISFTG